MSGEFNVDMLGVPEPPAVKTKRRLGLEAHYDRQGNLIALYATHPDGKGSTAYIRKIDGSYFRIRYSEDSKTEGTDVKDLPSGIVGDLLRGSDPKTLSGQYGQEVNVVRQTRKMRIESLGGRAETLTIITDPDITDSYRKSASGGFDYSRRKGNILIQEAANLPIDLDLEIVAEVEAEYGTPQLEIEEVQLENPPLPADATESGSVQSLSSKPPEPEPKKEGGSEGQTRRRRRGNLGRVRESGRTRIDW